VTGTSPTVRQRELGIRLRKYRLDLGYTVEDVAEKLLCSPTKISRAETGARRQSLRDVRDLSEIYKLDQSVTDELMQLAREAREPGWWSQFDDLRTHFPFIGLEQEATSITSFSMFFVPALMQTADYAASLIRDIYPKVSDEVLKERVEVRMRRQELLYGPVPPQYGVVIDEAVLRRHVGGKDVMRAQLGRITELAGEGKVSFQVLPFGRGAYMAADSNFEYLKFGESLLPDVVFVESLSQHLYLERPADVERYAEAVDSLRHTALSSRESIRLVQDIIQAYES
jgi:transcriptional regulator with XRE-family HTH domain